MQVWGFLVIDINVAVSSLKIILSWLFLASRLKFIQLLHSPDVPSGLAEGSTFPYLYLLRVLQLLPSLKDWELAEGRNKVLFIFFLCPQ